MAIEFIPLVAEYGYPAALLGALFEGETVLVLAGLFAHRGVLDLPLLVALGALGGALGDIAYFTLGRRYGAALLERYPKFAPAAARVQALIERFPESRGVRHPLSLRPAHRGPRGHRRQRSVAGRDSCC